jgi:predicted membrane protein
VDIMKKYTLCFAIAAALVAAAASVAAADKVESRSIAASGGDKDLHETWSVSADARVEISNVRGTVTVSGWDKPEVSLDGSLGRDSKLDISGDAGHLMLKVTGEKDSWVHGNGPDTDSDITLRVPRAAALDVNVVSADANVTGIAGKTLEVASVSGGISVNSGVPDVDVNSVSGDVTFDHTGAAMMRAHLQTVSGNINAKGLNGRVKVETVSGDMVVSAGAVQDLEAGTVSGDANLTFAPASHASVKLESMSGDLRVHLPSSVSAHIEATTFSGGIDSDFGKVQTQEMGPGSSLDAQAGAGDARINAQSFSGNIELRKQ